MRPIKTVVEPSTTTTKAVEDKIEALMALLCDGISVDWENPPMTVEFAENQIRKSCTEVLEYAELAKREA